MRWTLTSPDGLGDFLLRIPWIKAMESHGWTLQLVGRPFVLEAARLAGINAEFVSIKIGPYEKKAHLCPNPYRDELAAITKFSPDIVFFGPSCPTFFEDQLAEKITGLKTGGFIQRGIWHTQSIRDPLEIAKKHSLIVQVESSESDALRNMKAAGCLLGKSITLAPYRLKPQGRFEAPPFFPRGKKFLAVNVSSRDGESRRGLGENNWVRELNDLTGQTKLPLVFIGTENEIESHRRVVSEMNGEVHCVDLTGKVKALNELALIIAAAEAYIGKDCGAMHLAASLGKPVVAVFGGGTAPRFFPWGTRSVSLTNDVPCFGCDWRCHLPSPVCSEGIPEKAVFDAFKAVFQLNSEEGVVLKFPLNNAFSELLKMHPQNNLPLKMHSERKTRMIKERLDYRKPTKRILSRLLAIRDKIWRVFCPRRTTFK